MTCGNRNGQCRSAQTAYNDIAQPFVATGTPIIILGTSATDTGASIETEPTVFKIKNSGLYRISYDVDLTADAAGTVNVQLYDGQTPLPCATAYRTTAADLEYAIHVETTLQLNTCCMFRHMIGARISGIAGEITHVCASCVKLA